METEHSALTAWEFKLGKGKSTRVLLVLQVRTKALLQRVAMLFLRTSPRMSIHARYVLSLASCLAATVCMLLAAVREQQTLSD